MMKPLPIGDKLASLLKRYYDLARRTISGARLVIPVPAGRAVRFIMTWVKSLAVADPNVSLIATVVASLRYGIWYSPNTIRIAVGNAVPYLSQISILEWDWKGL